MKCVICSLLMLFLLTGCQDAEPATYYLPKNFEGFFSIIYSQSKGEKIKLINGRRQLFVPTSGILLVKADFSDGWRDDIFLIKTNAGFDTLKMYMPDSLAKKDGIDYDINNITTDS